MCFGFCFIGWRRCPKSVGSDTNFLEGRIQEFPGREGRRVCSSDFSEDNFYMLNNV